MIALRINVTKLIKDRFFHGKNRAIYADLILMENKDGPDQYGNTHFIAISATKEERLAGVKLPIVGNGKEFGQPAPKTASRAPERPRQDDRPPMPEHDSSEIPF